MFAIDFTKPYLYKDVVYFHQGNLSTNNTLRCTLNTGGSNDLTGCNIICTFKLQNSTEISGAGRIIDPLNAIVDLVFPSNALAVGLNKLEILVNRSDGSVAQSPSITYDIWQGLTTGNGIEAETNYPILIELINSTNEASNKANSALNKANSMITDITDAIDNAYRSANEADIATSNANTKIEEVETAKTEMIKKVDTSIETMKLSVEDAKSDMQATTDAKMQQVDNSIVTMKSEVETAKNEMSSKANEKIADIDRALAAGTVDLELKQAREDASGVIHDTIKQRLDSDLIVGDKSLKDFVIDMNGMKESQDLAYETDNSYQVCTDTQSGVVKNLKVHGKTMINNIVKVSEVRFTSNGTAYYSFPQGVPFSSGDIYTYIVFNVPSFITAMYLGNSSSSDLYISRTNSFEPKTFIAKESLQINDLLPHFYINEYREFTESEKSEIRKIKLMIVKGNYAKRPPQYFEGMTSVGNGTPLEVVTRKEDGNLLEYIEPGGTVGLVGDRFGTDFDDKRYFRSNYIDISNSKILSCSFEHFSQQIVSTLLCFYDENKKGMPPYVRQMPANVPIDAKYVRFEGQFSGVADATPFLNDIKVSIVNGVTPKSYVPLEQDKKPILYKDANGAWKPVTELNGIDKNNCDIVDTVKNRYVKKFIKYKVTGDETMGYITDYGAVSRFYIMNMFPKNNKLNAPPMCNILPLVAIGTSDVEGINSHSVSMNYISFQIKSSRLESKDVIGFKKWLKANNVEIVIELEVPQEYELNPIYPDSYEGDTMVMIKGGPLPIKASFKVTSSLPNFVKELSNQIKQLQDQVYKTNVANFTVALNTLDTKLRLDRLEEPQQ